MPSKYELELWGKTASQEYLGSGVPLDDTIAKIASDKGLNKNHIERVVQAANSYTNGALIKKAKAEKRDPRIRFDRAGAGKVTDKVASLSGHGPATSGRAREEVLNGLFSVARDAGLEKQAELSALERVLPRRLDPRADKPQAGESGELARAFLLDGKKASELVKVASSITLDKAISELESVRNVARHDHFTNKEAVSSLSVQLVTTLEDAILAGGHPVHIYGMAKQASISEDVCKLVEIGLVKKALELKINMDVSRIPPMPNGIVNVDHPVLKVASLLADAYGKTSASEKILSDATSALHAARGARAGAQR